MSEPYHTKLKKSHWVVYYKSKSVVDLYVRKRDAEDAVKFLNLGYFAGRRDALAEIEARRDKREEL